MEQAVRAIIDECICVPKIDVARVSVGRYTVGKDEKALFVRCVQNF